YYNFYFIVDIYSIKSVSFLYNNINITNYRHYNIFYFNYDNIPKDTQFRMTHVGVENNQNTITNMGSMGPVFYSTYNEKKRLFQIEFYIEENTNSGPYGFVLNFIGSNLFSSYLDTQLIIKNTKMDLQGPIFKTITKITSPKIDENNISGVIGWIMTIEDPINGFKSGYVTVRGSEDSSVFNYTFTVNDVKAGGNQYSGDYEVKLIISNPCIPQVYTITEVTLFDRLDRISYFSISPPNEYTSLINPFLYFLNDSNINKISVDCTPIYCTNPPDLFSFSASTKQLEVGGLNREISFTFTAYDLQCGIRTDQYPIVYLITTMNQVLECKSNITQVVVNPPVNDEPVYGNVVDYSCTIQVPFGFGYPGGIFISVYGFINNVGLFSGLSAYEMTPKDFDYYISTTFNENNPNLVTYYRITERGGDLWLFGSGFGATSTAFITFDDGSKSVVQASISNSTVIKLLNVKATFKPYKLYIKTNSLQSNIMTIEPTIFNIVDVPDPTETPPLTNKPQYCIGSPVCGGPSNGKCVENQGCVCFSPWIGNDCSSQIIIIDPPTANKTDPTTNITLPGTNNNNSTVTYKSLITLVSIREVNILGDMVYEKPFEKWTVKQLDDTTFIYNTTLEITKKDKKSTTTNVKVTLKWFTNETNVTFANEQLIMNPSSMKYTIEISDYSFDDSLSQLQLIMSALIQSNTTDDICSVREFGETTSGDNSNYVKIQIDNHSLYGRFIRRGFIDSTIRSVTNILLDKYMKPISGTKELQSYIGIQIPYYRESIILDPDFSVLIDSNSASSKSGSICSNKSKLSGPKIAGIVIGCVAFVAIILVIITYHFIKKRSEEKFISSVNKKAREMKEL
ncbi:hypothetical protein DICPUDRAFT_34568, partial [Dictyostelium purpureum]